MHKLHMMDIVTYEQAFEDWSYLWSIGPATDMTGAYEDQNDLDRLLRKPTKTTARKCLCDQIVYWLQTGPDVGLNTERRKAIRVKEGLMRRDARVMEIAKRHGYA